MKKQERGFTLIELMIVIAIIGILAAIAIPQFASYRIKAFNSAAKADMHSAQTTYEVFFNDASKYPNTVGVRTGKITVGASGATNVSFNTSKDVYFSSKVGKNNTTYSAATKHTSGDKIYQATSAAPTIVEKTGKTGTKLSSGDVPKAP